MVYFSYKSLSYPGAPSYPKTILIEKNNNYKMKDRNLIFLLLGLLIIPFANGAGALSCFDLNNASDYPHGFHSIGNSSFVINSMTWICADNYTYDTKYPLFILNDTNAILDCKGSNFYGDGGTAILAGTNKTDIYNCNFQGYEKGITAVDINPASNKSGPVWSKQLSSSYDGDFFSLDVDTYGDYIFAGKAYLSDYDWYAAKFSRDLTKLWTWNYTYSNEHESANDVLATNSHYLIAGFDAINGANDYQWRLTALDYDGVEKWQWTRDFSTGMDELKAITIDRDGNYLLAGSDYSSDAKWRVIKLDSDRNTVWSWSQNPSPNNETPNDIAVDQANNIVVAGQDKTANDGRFRVVKIAENGTTLWNWTQNPTADWDELRAIDVDLEGDYVAAGYEGDGGIGHFWKLAKINSSGSTIWSYTGGSNQAFAVDTDQNNDYLVAGSAGGTSPDWAVRKISTDGANLWDWTKAQAGAGYDLKVDEHGDYIAAGYDYVSFQDDLSIIKITPEKNIMNLSIQDSGFFASDVFITSNATISGNGLRLGDNIESGYIEYPDFSFAGGHLTTDFIDFSDKYVSLHDKLFNTSANITLSKTGDCSELQYYKKDGFPQSRSSILSGSIFEPDFVDCSASKTTFSVDSFSGYTTKYTEPSGGSDECASDSDCPGGYECVDGDCEEIPESCDDGIKNQDETGVDCGGPCEACPTCDDGIQNQNETGVDCGGPCIDCQTCYDNIKNQGEEGIDCGGPCEPCQATCDDGLQNQNETGIDCGGSCEPCASCDDGIKNQDEVGIDCGGICKPCPTCNDSIKNQNETGIDCGGVCKPCASCKDGIKNQGEIGVDCGGPCRSCESSSGSSKSFETSTSSSHGFAPGPGSCTDSKKNCHSGECEEGIDCGGPCGPCASCSDNIQNCHHLKNSKIACEKGVDCGGPCESCGFSLAGKEEPLSAKKRNTCSDGVKNCQIYEDGSVECEELTDCGGPCQPCTIREKSKDVAVSTANVVFSWQVLLVVLGVVILKIFVREESLVVIKKLRDRFKKD
mgnify:CR=1 FL=1